MTHRYDYLIIGGGLAADAAVKGIRELDAAGSIGLIGREPVPPYMRPSLSKGLWKGRPVEKIWRKTEERGAVLHLGSRAVQLDPHAKSVCDENGDEYAYGKLLIATGGSPARLPFDGEGSGGGIIYYRDFADYQRLRALSEKGERFLVIGGGFIGSEIAAALALNGKKAVLVFPDEAIGAALYPPDLSLFLNDYYREKGVEVVPGDHAVSVEPSGEGYRVRTQGGRVFEVDGVVAGIGIRPNVELAQQAGLRVKNGIAVDEWLHASAADVYAAGDVANFYHFSLGKRLRVEHEDNAVQMGRLAGRNMAGAGEVYTHAPMFYSDLFDLGYEAVGELSAGMETFSDWQEPFKKGVVYYLQAGRVRGVLLWNVWDKVPAARQLLAEKGPLAASDLKGRL